MESTAFTLVYVVSATLLTLWSRYVFSLVLLHFVFADIYWLKVILSQFTQKKAGQDTAEQDLDDDETLDEEELEAAADVDPEREAHDMQEINEIEKELKESLEALAQTEKEVALGRSALAKVRLSLILIQFLN